MAGTKLEIGDVRRDVTVKDGLENRSDGSREHRDVPDICNGTDTTTDTTEFINARRNTMQAQNLPVGAGRRDQVEPRSCAGTYGVAYHANTANDMQERVSTCSADAKSPNSLTRSTRLYSDLPDGLRPTQAHRGHEYMRIEMQAARIHLQTYQKTRTYLSEMQNRAWTTQ